MVSEWFNQAQFPDCITIFMDSGKTSTTFHQILHGMGLCSSGQQSPSPPHTGVHRAYREMLSVQQTFLSGDTPCRTCLIEHASQIKSNKAAGSEGEQINMKRLVHFNCAIMIHIMFLLLLLLHSPQVAHFIAPAWRKCSNGPQTVLKRARSNKTRQVLTRN